jgi:hypothetical protein
MEKESKDISKLTHVREGKRYQTLTFHIPSFLPSFLCFFFIFLKNKNKYILMGEYVGCS